MISREQSLLLRQIYLDDDEAPIELVPLREILDALDAALKVVEAAKALIRTESPWSAGYDEAKALVTSLAPFTAPRGKE